MTTIAMRRGRFAGIAGIVFFLLLGTTLFVATPSPSDPAQKTVDAFMRHRTAILVGCYLSVAAAVAFVAFIAGLRGLLGRTAGDDEGTLPAVAFAASVLGAGVAGVWQAIIAGLALSGAANGDHAVVQALMRVGGTLGFFSDAFFAVVLAAICTVALRSRALPRALGVVGLVTAALLLLNQLSIENPQGPLGLAGFLGFLLLLLWTLATGITLLRRSGTPAPRPARG